jgi:hypothetical protein
LKKLKSKTEEEKIKELHEHILKAFNEVPNFEGFTTKDLTTKLDMPEPKKRLHLD